MSIAQMMAYLTQQSQMMANMMQMWQLDRPQAKDRLANVRLDERNFRTVGKFNNRRDGWEERKLHFMASVRECDTSFADYVWAHEKLGEEVNIMTMDPTQTQLATNLHNRLISCTIGSAFKIVESTAGNNGVEAWRQLNHRFGPKTDARLTSLVLTIMGIKIKGKDVQPGLVQWESQLLALESR